MVINQKTLVFLTLVPVCLLLGCFSVRGEAVASDPLWMQAVQLAGRNQDLMPGKLYKQTKELNFFGRVRSTEESWSDFVEAEDGKVECKEVKKIMDGQEIVTGAENRTANQKDNWKYSSDFTDFTLPFRPKTQPDITVKRSNRLQMKAGQKCALYNFRCATATGAVMIGRAWINQTGVPVALEYTLNPLPPEVREHLRRVTHEVSYQYQADGSWYPYKVCQRLKGRSLNSITSIALTFSEYRKPKNLEVMTGGKVLNPQKLPCVVPFDYLDRNIYVNVRLNDTQKEYRFLIDTGAGLTVISHRAAIALGLAKVAETMGTDGYISKNIALTTIKKIDLGELRVADCAALIFDFTNLEIAGIKIDGILGSNFLRLFTVRIDYDKQMLTLSRNADSFGAELGQGYQILLNQDSTGLITTPFKIPGTKNTFWAEIDTGSNGGLQVPGKYLEEFTSSLNCPVVNSQGIVTKGAFGGSAGKLARLSKFELGEIHIKNYLVSFVETKLDFLVIGNEFWQQFNLIIDYPTNTMYLLPLKKQDFATNIKTYGFGIEKNANGESQVVMIWEGSAADRSGMRVGDLILRAEAEVENGTSYEDIVKLREQYDTIHLFIRREDGEAELILTKEWLLPEVK